MKTLHYMFVCVLLSCACAYGQMTVISTAPKDPEIKPEQRTSKIIHYEKMRFTARTAIRVLAMALQNTDGPQKTKLNEAIDNQADIVDWANWCILAIRDNTADAKTCVFAPEVK
jgi:hypothetical protein